MCFKSIKKLVLLYLVEIFFFSKKNKKKKKEENYLFLFSVNKNKKKKKKKNKKQARRRLYIFLTCKSVVDYMNGNYAILLPMLMILTRMTMILQEIFPDIFLDYISSSSSFAGSLYRKRN